MNYPNQPPAQPSQPYPAQAYTAGYGDAAGAYPAYVAPQSWTTPRTLSARGRAVAVCYALAATMLFHLISIPLLLWENSLVGRYGIGLFDSDSAPAEFGFWGLATVANAFFLILATLATVVLFLMWIHRAYRVLEVNHVAALRSTSGWAVGWWFIPFANLVKPYEITKEIFERSERRQWSEGARTKESSWIVGAWWLTWLVATFATNITGFMSGFSAGLSGGAAPSAEQYIRTNLLTAGATVLFILAGVLAIMVVRDIDQRQRRAFTNHPSPTPTQYPR